MVEIRPCYVLEATYIEGAAEKRIPFRDEHLDRVARLIDEGVIVVAGAYEDMSASLLVLAVSSQEEAEAVARRDVYYREGIWDGFSVRKLNRVV